MLSFTVYLLLCMKEDILFVDAVSGILVPGAYLSLSFCCLERFSINVVPEYWGVKPWNWEKFSNGLKNALSNIIHSSYLKTLSLKGVTGVPMALLLCIVHLTTLELHFVPPNVFRYKNSSSLTHAAAMGVASTDPHPVIDRCIWRWKENSEHRSENARSTRFPSSSFSH